MAREVSCVGEGSRTGDLGQDVRATRAPSLTLGGLHRWQLRALLFENGFGLPGGLLFLAEGAGYVAERRGLGQRRAELPERTLALRVGVGSSADESGLGRERMRLGMQRMAGRLNNLWLAGECSLSEGAGGTENEADEERDFHRCLVRVDMGWCNLDTNLRGL